VAYSELIKNLDRIRAYVREFYVYGFRTRMEYGMKSARSYDDERRRLASWLGGYMHIRQEADGRNVYLSVDSRSVARNPLHQVFRSKSFTDCDITLHFFLLDLLCGEAQLTVRQIMEGIERYLAHFEDAVMPDESTVRKKLKEYEKLGLLRSKKQGRERIYSRAADRVPLERWAEAAAFFSETDVLGVIGASILDKMAEPPDYIRYKHHYILGILDSEILAQLLAAIAENRVVELRRSGVRAGRNVRVMTVCPLKIYAGTESGRQYLLAWNYAAEKLVFCRLDTILSVRPGNKEENIQQYLQIAQDAGKRLWGVSLGDGRQTEHVEMILQVGEDEYFILNRLNREKRCGAVEQLDKQTFRFTADVFDAGEMLPWLRSFTGRIKRFSCSNAAVQRRFDEDMAAMARMYGGESDV